MYNYLNVFADCMQAIRSNSAGYGDYYITVDLSEYFTIRELDEHGKYKQDDVTDIIKNYSVLKFHYDENGIADFPLNAVSCYWTNEMKNKKEEVAIYIATKQYDDCTSYREYCANNSNTNKNVFLYDVVRIIQRYNRKIFKEYEKDI